MGTTIKSFGFLLYKTLFRLFLRADCWIELKLEFEKFSEVFNFLSGVLKLSSAVECSSLISISKKNKLNF